MKQYHCTICVQSKPITQFSKWTADKTKARRCDSCQEDPEVAKRIEKSKREAELKEERKPTVVKPTDEDKCDTRNKIDEFLYNRRVDDDIGDKD